MELMQEIPTDWFQDTTLLVGVSGVRYAHKTLDFLEILSAYPGIKIRVLIERSTLDYITRKNFERFADVHILSFSDVTEIQKHASQADCFVFCTLDELCDVDPDGIQHVLPDEYPFYHVSGGQNHSVGDGFENIQLSEEWETVLEAVALGCAKRHLWENKKVLVTAGRTEEPIDPVRLITNRSSGKMGFALARQAALRGAEVTLVAGPTNLRTPYGVNRIDVMDAGEMLKAAEQVFPEIDVVFAAAAVEDLKPVKVSRRKIKKRDRIDIECTTAVDVLQSLSRQKTTQCLVGFSVETEELIRNSREKLQRKSLDAIVANNPNQSGAGFQHDTNQVTVITRSDVVQEFPLMSKEALAGKLLEFILQEMQVHELG